MCDEYRETPWPAGYQEILSDMLSKTPKPCLLCSSLWQWMFGGIWFVVLLWNMDGWWMEYRPSLSAKCRKYPLCYAVFIPSMLSKSIGMKWGFSMIGASCLSVLCYSLGRLKRCVCKNLFTFSYEAWFEGLFAYWFQCWFFTRIHFRSRNI